MGRKISEFFEKLEPELGCNFTDLQVLSECQFIPQIKIESLNATYRKLNRQRSVFPSEVDLLKALYLSTSEATKKWTKPIHNWGQAYGELIVPGETLVPQRASVISSTRRTDTPARYISMSASSTEHSLLR